MSSRFSPSMQFYLICELNGTSFYACCLFHSFICWRSFLRSIIRFMLRSLWYCKEYNYYRLWKRTDPLRVSNHRIDIYVISIKWSSAFSFIMTWCVVFATFNTLWSAFVEGFTVTKLFNLVPSNRTAHPKINYYCKYYNFYSIIDVIMLLLILFNTFTTCLTKCQVNNWNWSFNISNMYYNGSTKKQFSVKFLPDNKWSKDERTIWNRIVLQLFMS